MTQYTGDPDALNAQVREFLGTMGITDEATIASLHALAFANGGDIETAYADMIIAQVDATPHTTLEFLFDQPVAEDQELKHDPRLRRRVFAYVLRQANGTEAMAEDVYRLVLTGVSMELAYRELSSGEELLPGGISLFDSDAIGGAFGNLPDLDLGDISGKLGLDLSQVIGLGENGAVEIDVSALIDAMAAGSGAQPSERMRDVIAQMVGDQLRESAADMPGVTLNLTNQPLLSPKQRLEAVVTGWALKGLMMYDTVKNVAGNIAEPITRRVHTMKDQTTAEIIIKGLSLSLRLSSLAMLILGIRGRKTPEGARLVQWSMIVVSSASIVDASAKLAGLIPMESKKHVDLSDEI